MISRKIILVSSSKKLIKIYQLKHFEKCEKISFLYIELLPCWKGWKRLMWTHWIFVDPFWVWPQKARENSGATKIKWRNVRVSPMAHALMHLSLSLSLQNLLFEFQNLTWPPNTQSKRNSKSRDQFDRYSACLSCLLYSFVYFYFLLHSHWLVFLLYLLSLRFMVRSVILWDVQWITNTIFCLRKH